MTYRVWLVAILIAALAAAAAQEAAAADASTPPYLDASRSVDERVADLLGRMTLEEKIGQMTLVEKGSIGPADVARYAIGGVLSGGGGYPAGDNTVDGWVEMVHGYQDAALSTRLAIPLLYGVDAVHGHANLVGATVFPHNVGLGAADDPELVEAIARATAREMIATGIYWNYAPVLAVPRDIRWGRSYEGYGEDPELVTRLSRAALRGLQGDDLSAADTVLATPKHYVGDGGTAFRTSPVRGGLLDQGDTLVDEQTLRRVHLAPYVEAVDGGARSIMISFSSWQGEPMHGHSYLIRDVLRGELGFDGFVVSDWGGVDAVARGYDQAVALSIEAGIDMNMVPHDYRRFIAATLRGVERGELSLERIDEAVAAILRVKFELGLFERPYGDAGLQASVGSPEHRALAREAAASTVVLLKNDDSALPLRAEADQTVLVAGFGSDSVGMQSGGWTIEWQGSTASLTPGTTILDALRAGFGLRTTVLHDLTARFTDADGAPLRGDVGIAVIGERPYAEWFGDSATLSLGAADVAVIERLREQVDVLVIVLLSGRPLVMDVQLNLADAVVAAWLPGSEGDGVTDVLFGEREVTGTLPYTWPRHIDQLPFDFDDLPGEGCDAPLFPRGYGLRYGEGAAENPWLDLAVACAEGGQDGEAAREDAATGEATSDDATAADPASDEDAAAAFEPTPGPALRLADFSDGVPTGIDAFGNGIGFVTWHDGSGSLALSAVTVEPGDPLALPGQVDTEHVLRVEHRIVSWGGFSHAFEDEAMTRWVGRDLSAYAGLRFWYQGAGSGRSVQVDLFDNRNPDLTGDSAERFYYRFVDDSTEWRLIEIPFSSFARRMDWQPAGAPNDGLGLTEASGWALGFPPGEGTTHVARAEAYGASEEAVREAITVEFEGALVRVHEGESGELQVTLSEASHEPVTVRVLVRGDEAAPHRNFVPVDELVAIPAGETEAAVTLHTLADGRHTGDLRAQALLEDPRGASLGFQRRAVVMITDADPFDPDLLADFGDSPEPFEAGPGTTLSAPELPADAADARPGQAAFEGVLAFSWQDRGAVETRFGQSVDVRHADGIEFWYFGDGSGREVRVEISSGSDETRPWELVWSDEFEGPAGPLPAGSVWTPEIGDGTDHGIPGWGNAERQTYTAEPENLALDGEGHLVIRAVETDGDAPLCYYGAPCEYTSARIITRGALEVEYGRIEGRIKIPYGQGLWPAFWMLGNDIGEVGWPQSGEIDIMENVGREPHWVHGTIHGPGYSGGDGIGRGTTLPDGGRFADDFHVYAIEWWPDRITWSVDGVEYSTLTPADLPSGARWVFDHPFFLILNVAVGGHWPGYPDQTTTFPQEMLVDYVRVYGAPDTAARFEAGFRDEAEGWTLVRLPFADFERAAAQPDGAPDDEAVIRGEVWGLGIEVGGGAGSAMIDEVRWYVDE